MPSAPLILCLDIGGTSTRIAICDLPTEQTAPPAITTIASFPTEQAYNAQLTRLGMELMRWRANEGQNISLAGVGVSIGGRVTRDGSSVAVAPNLPNYVGRPLAGDLAALYGVPVRLAHDTICGLLGEKHYGALAAYERCAYLTLSTGTGAAVYLGQGATGLALSIEFGHQRVDGDTLPCLCGQIGCLETFTGGRQVALRYKRPIEEIDDQAFWATFVEKLALGLVNLVNLTRVEASAVGGAIAIHRPSLLPALQASVDNSLRNATLRLLPAALGENAPLVGAVTLVQEPSETVLS